MRGLLAQLGAPPIGLEVAPGFVRAAQARRGARRWILVGASEAAIEGPTDDAGRPDPACVARAAHEALGAARFLGRRVVVGLDDALVASRSTRHPPLRDAERAQAVALDAPGRLGLPEAGSVVDYLWAGEVRQGDERRDELIYVGAESPPLEALLFELDRAGLTPAAVEPAFVATARGAAPDLHRGADAALRALVGVEDHRTSVTLARGPDVVFHKRIGVGADAITLAAAERLGVPPAEAAEIRRRRMRGAGAPRSGVTTDAKVDRALYEAARPIMTQIGHEVALCLRHYGTTFRGVRAERCLLVGASALEPRLAETIEEAAGAPAAAARPFEGLDLSGVCGPIERRGPNAEFAAALGLALRHAVRRAGRPTGPPIAPGPAQAASNRLPDASGAAA